MNDYYDEDEDQIEKSIKELEALETKAKDKKLKELLQWLIEKNKKLLNCE